MFFFLLILSSQLSQIQLPTAIGQLLSELQGQMSKSEFLKSAFPDHTVQGTVPCLRILTQIPYLLGNFRSFVVPEDCILRTAAADTA